MKQQSRIKLVLLLFLFGTMWMGYAQSKVLRGTVMDSQSKTGIEGVIISTADGTNYTLTNDEGDFEFTIEDQVESIWFSQINYQVKEVSTKAAMLIELNLINKDLDEIVLFSKSLDLVFGPALQQSINFVEKGDLYRTYSREFNMVNENLSNVADGLVDYYIENPKKTPKIEVTQNRVFYSSKDKGEGTFEEVMNTVGLGDIRDFLTNTGAIGAVQKIFDEKTPTSL